MSVLKSLSSGIKAMEAAGNVKPAEIMLASDGQWDLLAAEIQGISLSGDPPRQHLGTIAILGVEITCPRIIEARKAQAYREGNDAGQLAAYQKLITEIPGVAQTLGNNPSLVEKLS